MACPEMWKHMGCVYLPQPRHPLAIIHKQGDVPGFRLTILAVEGLQNSWRSF